MHSRVIVVSMMTAAPIFWPAILSAQTLTENAAAFATEVRAAGCVIDGSNADAIRTAAGLSVADAIDASYSLTLSGGIVPIVSGQMRLAPALCDPMGHGDIRESLVALLRLNGCAMNESVANVQAPGLGLDPDMTVETARRMFAVGELTRDGDWVMLSDGLCTGRSGALATPRSAVLEALEEVGCAAPESALLPVLVGQGFDDVIASELLRFMVLQGELTEHGGTYHLAGAGCDANGGGGADPVEEVLQAIRANGCSITNAELAPLIATLERDWPVQEVVPAGERLAVMFHIGEIVESGNVFTLSPALCEQGVVAEVESAADRLRAMDPAEVAFDLDAILRAGGCNADVSSLNELDAAFSAPLAARIGLGFGADAAQDEALRMLAVAGLDLLRNSGRLTWDSETGGVRLSTCF